MITGNCKFIHKNVFYNLGIWRIESGSVRLYAEESIWILGPTKKHTFMLFPGLLTILLAIPIHPTKSIANTNRPTTTVLRESIERTSQQSRSDGVYMYKDLQKAIL